MHDYYAGSLVDHAGSCMIMQDNAGEYKIAGGYHHPLLTTMAGYRYELAAECIAPTPAVRELDSLEAHAIAVSALLTRSVRIVRGLSADAALVLWKLSISFFLFSSILCMVQRVTNYRRRTRVYRDSGEGSPRRRRVPEME